MTVAEMRTVCWMCGHTKSNRIRNIMMSDKGGVTSINDKMRQAKLRWFDYVKKGSIESLVRWKTITLPEYRMGQDRPKKRVETK